MRFLVEPVGVEAVGGFQQGGDLLGEPGPDRLGLAAGRGFRLLRQPLDLVHPLLQDLSERRALAAAHLDEMVERLLEGPGGGIHRRLVLGFVALGLDHLDHALDAEQPVDARRHRVDLLGQRARHLDDRGQHVLVDAHRRDRVAALDG